jgi:hypothetical protein
MTCIGPEGRGTISKSLLEVEIGNHRSPIKRPNANGESFPRFHWRDRLRSRGALLVNYRSLTLGMAVIRPFVLSGAASLDTAKASRINSPARSWAAIRHFQAIEAFSALHRKLAFFGNSDQKATPTHSRYKLPESRSIYR